MTNFKSMPNSSANQKFLQNVQSFSKANKVNQEGLVKYLEKQILNALQYANSAEDVKIQSVQMDQRNGDLIVNVSEKGKLQKYINPGTGKPSKGKWMPFGDWKQNNGDVNEDGEPVDENGMTKKEYDNNEKSLADFGWDDILFGKSWGVIFWGEPKPWTPNDEAIKELKDKQFL